MTADLRRLVVARLYRRFCIGFEMPPWLMRLLTPDKLWVGLVSFHATALT